MTRGPRAPRLCCALGSGALVALVVLSGPAVLAEPANRWLDVMRAKAWVTASARASRPQDVPVSIDRLVVCVGGAERIVYELQPKDLNVGDPIVSPDGTLMAFIKEEQEGSQTRRRLYVSSTASQDVRLLIELKSPGFAMRGTRIGPAPVAWTHDNRLLALFADLPGDPSPDPTKLGEEALSRLRVVTVATGESVVLVRAGRRVVGGIWGSVITSQAWAPDGRRLVYMKDDGRATILDTTSGSEEDLGVGTEPTWSPDGHYIAVRVSPAGKEPSSLGGNYVLIRLATRERRVVIPDLASRRAAFYGPAIWFPGAEFMMIHRLRGERPEPWLLDRATGELSKMPPGSWGPSWGGRP